MHRKLPIFFSVALGAAFIIAPSITNIGSDNAYDSAIAAKGGNGKGNGGGNGNAGGNGNGGGNGGSNSASANASGSNSSVMSGGALGKQKVSSKELALNDPTAPAHPSMLGRWNAAKPIDHPSIQAHIRNGNYNGTIGMVAGYAEAQANYNSYQTNLANADPTVSALAAALTAAGYSSVAEYNTAVANGTIADPAIDTALGSTTDTTTGVTTTTMTAEQIAAADALVAQGATAFTDLSSAEANMETWSNRSPWSEIRDDVRTKMGLDPTENDLVTTTTSPVTTTP